MAEIDRRSPLHLDVRDLRLVLTVAEAGSLSRAADALHLAQSTLSHHLAELEGRLGAPLFLRLGRRLQRTMLGDRLVAGAAPLLVQVRELEERLRAAEPAPVQELRVGAECYTTYPWLARVTRGLRGRQPVVRLRIVPEATRRPLAALEADQLDLAITTAAPRGRLFLAAPLFTDELVAVVASDHPWAGRAFVTPADFAAEHLFTYAPDPAESSFVRDTLLRAGVLPRAMSGLPLTEGLVELARSGTGVAVLARWALSPHLGTGGVLGIRIGRGGVRRTWHAVRLRASAAADAVDAVVRLLREAGPEPTGRTQPRRASSSAQRV